MDAYSLTKNEIYFDRIINELCVMNFAKDLDFWLIKEINLEICCVDKFKERSHPCRGTNVNQQQTTHHIKTTEKILKTSDLLFTPISLSR